MGLPLTYTTRQVQEVKNGMTRQKFLQKYGDNLRTHNTFYKIQRLSPLSNISLEPKVEAKFPHNLGNIKQITQRTADRALSLLNILNDTHKNKSVIPNFDYLSSRGMIIKKMGKYSVTEAGKNFLDAVMDNTKGFCNSCKEIKTLDNFHPSSIEHSGRAGDNCKQCKQKNYFSQSQQPNTRKVSKTQKIWNEFKKLFPKLVWE
jgi:hypothetical protein